MKTEEIKQEFEFCLKNAKTFYNMWLVIPEEEEDSKSDGIRRAYIEYCAKAEILATVLGYNDRDIYSEVTSQKEVEE